jgi:hypothetical protein
LVGTSGNGITIDVSKSGYTPIGLVGWTNPTGSSFITEANIVGNELVTSVYAINGASNLTMKVKILYKKLVN